MGSLYTVKFHYFTKLCFIVAYDFSFYFDPLKFFIFLILITFELNFLRNSNAFIITEVLSEI